MLWWVLSFFIASLSLWLGKGKVRNHWRGVDELYGLYLLHRTNGQMQMYLIASSIKIINKRNVFAMYQFKSARTVLCWDLCICMFLGCNLPIQLLLKSLSSTYNDRLIDHFYHVLIYITNKSWICPTLEYGRILYLRTLIYSPELNSHVYLFFNNSLIVEMLQ